MLEIVATGHTWSGGDGPYTLTPLVGLLLTLFLIRSPLGFPLRAPALAVSIGLGTLFATVADTWGTSIAITVWVLGAILATAVIRSGRRSFGAEPPD